MLGRQRSGSVVCSCGKLVGVHDAVCSHCGRRNPGLWGYAGVLRRLGSDLGFVKLLIGGSVLLYLVALLLSGGRIRMGSPFDFLGPSPVALYLLGASGSVPVFELGRWWTVLSAGWLHGSLLHLLFNMLWVRQLAPATAELYGAGRMVLIYTAGSVGGFLASSVAGHYLFFLPRLLQGAAFTVGASAPIFGLLGALVWYGRRSGSRALGQQAWTWALAMFVFGFLFAGVDNYAHAGGFAGGWLAARLLDPLRPERPGHVLTALGLLAATLLAVLVSVLQSFTIAS
ncbi:MAG: rhomboid family intramembrane serine protease [Acidobacteria bacterium]|nr:rhomboid family intramembrane serine protease [Acidobacteriota bacterium]